MIQGNQDLLLGFLVSLIRECKSRLKQKLRGNYTLKEKHPGQANCKSQQLPRTGEWARQGKIPMPLESGWHGGQPRGRKGELQRKIKEAKKRSILKTETEKKKKETLHLSDSGLHGSLQDCTGDAFCQGTAYYLSKEPLFLLAHQRGLRRACLPPLDDPTLLKDGP